MADPLLKPWFELVAGTPRPEFSAEFVDSQECAFVPRHYWAHTDSSHRLPILYGRGKSDVLILGLHDAEQGHAVLGTMNNSSNIPASIQKMLNAMPAKPDRVLSFGIASGQEVPDVVVGRVLDALRINKIDICKAGDICYVTHRNTREDRPSLGVDSRDGTFISPMDWPEDNSHNAITPRVMDARLASFEKRSLQPLEEIILAR